MNCSRAMSALNLAVIGSGVVGLTTAIELQKQFRNANVHIIADKFLEDTVSHVAAGLFRPGPSFSGPTEEITRQWINDSYHYWDDLRNTVEGAKAGITLLPGFIFAKEHPHIVRNHHLEKLVPIYRSATEEELQLCPGGWKYGSFFVSLLIQGSEYLPWATAKFKAANGRIINQRIESFSGVDKKYDAVVNCTGLGAKLLCEDNKLVPIRGQVLKVEAPWLKTFFFGEYDTYIIPGFNSVTLGGCRNYDSYDTNVNKYDAVSIKERCESLVPSLKNAKVLAHKVGLRPHRDPVRVQKEIVKLNDGKALKIVHNYGHGGFGVTTASGTALHAVRLVQEILSGNSKL